MNPRLAILAGALGAFVLWDAAVRAAEVYPGCAVPAAKFNHVWYVDPVNGKTEADGGDGSRAAPWNSLSAIVSSTNSAWLCSASAQQHSLWPSATSAGYYPAWVRR